MNSYTPKTFKHGDIYQADDVNRLENNIALLTNAINAITSLNNIWIGIEPPEDKSMLFIDLSDNADGVTSIMDSIFNEYAESIKSLTEEVNRLKQIIESGGIIVPDNPSIDTDTNNYILLENGLMLLTEDSKPILCEEDRVINDYDNIKINDAILLEDNRYVLTEDNKVILLG